MCGTGKTWNADCRNRRIYIKWEVFFMRNIIVVEAVSTGYNFVEDIYRRGYNPVVLEPLDPSDDIIAKRRTG